MVFFRNSTVMIQVNRRRHWCWTSWTIEKVTLVVRANMKITVVFETRIMIDIVVGVGQNIPLVYKPWKSWKTTASLGQILQRWLVAAVYLLQFVVSLEGRRPHVNPLAFSLQRHVATKSSRVNIPAGILKMISYQRRFWYNTFDLPGERAWCRRRR